MNKIPILKLFSYKMKKPGIMSASVMIVILFNCNPERKLPDINYFDRKPPGMTAELFAPGIISTYSFEHSSPAFSPEGSVVLWTVVDRNFRASMFEMKYEQGKWSSPGRPTFADSTADDYYPSFSPDGKRLYFSSRRKLPLGYPDLRDMQLWEVERNQNGWGTPVPVDTTVSQGSDYAHSITSNGTIYISSALGGGTNFNIRKAENKNGSFSKPVVLPYNINGTGYEDGPYIAPDESFIIFESDRPHETDGFIDLYISFKNEEGNWTLPVNMGPKINSPFAERFARLSPDGKYLFFGSNRTQSTDNWGFDIYWIDAKVIDELRNEADAKNAMEQQLGENLIAALYAYDYKTSAGLLKQWLDHHPGDLDATVIYSSTMRKLKRFAEAEVLLEGKSEWKNNPSVIMEKALSKSGLNKNDEASTLLSPILAAGDRQRDRYVQLSNELLEMGKYSESDGYFEKAMAINSNGYEYLRRARAYAKAGEKDQAFQNLDKAAGYGYISKQEFVSDADLAALRQDSRWKKLIDTLK